MICPVTNILGILSKFYKLTTGFPLQNTLVTGLTQFNVCKCFSIAYNSLPVIAASTQIHVVLSNSFANISILTLTCNYAGKNVLVTYGWCLFQIRLNTSTARPFRRAKPQILVPFSNRIYDLVRTIPVSNYKSSTDGRIERQT